MTTPDRLIKDKMQTPFNIGRPITLAGFKEGSVAPLEKGIKEKTASPQAILKEILYWTNGQPFLTQKICQIVANFKPAEQLVENEEKLIERLVRDKIIKNWYFQDEPTHLKSIQERILSNENQAVKRLGLYQKIFERGVIDADDSIEQIELQLSGLILKENNKVKVYNRIYRKNF